MKALDAAKFLVNLAIDNEKPMTNLKLQKMLYLAQAESNATLIEEDFQAWEYGPVVPSVYRNYRNGASRINSKDEEVEISDDNRNALEETYRKYGDKEPWDLSDATHAVASWIDNYDKDTKNKVIPKESIKNDREKLRELLCDKTLKKK
ncbi:Panacea domain-containing protein [Helicobacter cetorum]|uniref:Prophage protein n=1 Tax=Helicobacter cetorum (strain ATCC BAA-540 / CCUG 52418 / MIT 99-5656) TaxID=1163745 RepID=I0EQB0_HELCM|nr:type II toxin-antitoxin system antitoxin SocA domain-containing protein [Helicobacter cetorum]AFI05129.1 prophage protein [Helicobacter cetorum MIT 99-5656]